MDYRSLGLKVGLEIHVQLESPRKLFCECPPVIRNDEPHFRIVRRLRPTLSELGEVDPAALWEFRKRKTYIYEGYRDTTCLVELDEEPPHDPDPFSLETALLIAKMFNAKIFDELYVMRKIVIDGSNVSGFQRTMLVAHDGLATFFNYKVPIWTIALEEDAARKIAETESYIIYRLDRLGIPLVEISTGPLSYLPSEIAEIASCIGYSIKLTGRAKRGAGTVRQDLNVSIEKGAKTEIKGIPDLSLIPKVIEYEVVRQLNLLKIMEELKRRGVREEDIVCDYVEVTDIFQNTKSKMIRKIVEEGGKILALKLPEGFRGLLKVEVQPGRRFGTELADYVRAWTSLKGILHSDELPGYGITRDEVARIEERTGGKPFIIVAGQRESELLDAMDVLVKRLRQALHGVPEETRAANPDGTTRFMRPRPGSARMYPETDLRPVNARRIMLVIEGLVPE
ncbi:MAG: Glu-tRNA(Gln) amidotransferase subunit GatE, partial [Crenarchaeota archaeon]|nr:Glu-tRNA(Gln) amidotransferase subunit GatE [Thermoproteota archaeon]